MKRAILLLLLVSAPAGAQTGLESANYKTVDLIIALTGGDTDRIGGLTKDMIQTRVELRLRSVGLTPVSVSHNRPYLRVQISVQGNSFDIDIEYVRLVTYRIVGKAFSIAAVTWNKGSIGTAYDSAIVISSLDRLLDTFLNAYLKANQALSLLHEPKRCRK